MIIKHTEEKSSCLVIIKTTCSSRNDNGEPSVNDLVINLLKS